MLKVMQPMVAELGQAAGQRRHEALKAVEHCKSYYQMLALSTDALLQQAASAPTRCARCLQTRWNKGGTGIRVRSGRR